MEASQGFVGADSQSIRINNLDLSQPALGLRRGRAPLQEEGPAPAAGQGCGGGHIYGSTIYIGMEGSIPSDGGVVNICVLVPGLAWVRTYPMRVTDRPTDRPMDRSIREDGESGHARYQTQDACALLLRLVVRIGQIGQASVPLWNHVGLGNSVWPPALDRRVSACVASACQRGKEASQTPREDWDRHRSMVRSAREFIQSRTADQGDPLAVDRLDCVAVCGGTRDDARDSGQTSTKPIPVSRAKFFEKWAMGQTFFFFE